METKEKVLATIKADGNENQNRDKINASSEIISNDFEYCHSLLDEASDFDIIGFEKEKRALIEVLARKDRANILIVGETGVGKTCLIESLVKLVKDKQMPGSLANMNPFELDIISLSQGVSYKGEIEDVK